MPTIDRSAIPQSSQSAATLVSAEDGLFRLEKDDAALHVLTANPPANWKNYLFNPEYYIELDQCAQGRTLVLADPRRELPASYRYFYLKDEQDGDVWNLTCRPLNRTMDAYEAIHTPAQAEYRGRRLGIESRVTGFVPLAGSRELWTVVLKNTSGSSRRLSLFTVFPFEDGGVMHAKAWYDSGIGACFSRYFPHHLRYEGYEQHRGKATLRYLFSTRRPSSGESGERGFFGGPDFSAVPRAVLAGACSGDACGAEFPVGALHHCIELDAGESVEIGFCAGVEREETVVRRLQTELADTAAFAAALAAVRAGWANYRDGLRIETPDTTLNAFFNHWLQKQIVFQSRLNRLATGFPIRNQLQDCLGYALLDPAAALAYLRTRLPLQNTDGYLRQWWTQGDSDKHEVCSLDYKDGGIWLVICSIIVANQNGSLDFMSETFPFRDDARPVTVFEHLLRAVRNLADSRGAHRLCLFGDGDWTDPINGPGRRGRGESTWTTCALGVAVQRLREVAGALGLIAEADWLRQIDDELRAAVHAHCWNGAWYVAGFDDDGVAFGTSDDEEGRIFLNSQTWAIMAGYVSEDRLDATLAAIRSLETPAGSLVLKPAFTRWNPTWGRISLKQPGTSENGSVYCHAGMFKAYAECFLGDGESALREIIRNLPLNAANPPSRNTQPPIFVPNSYFGMEGAPDFGVSTRLISTGTAPWMLWVMVEGILGVRATPKGLLINPCMPDSWAGANLVRQFRGSTYVIAMRRGLTDGETMRILVDGEVLPSRTLPWGKKHYGIIVVY